MSRSGYKNPAKKRKTARRRSAKRVEDRKSTKFTLYSGLYLYFPPLTEEQESKKQAQVVEGRRKNKENWHPNQEKISKETRSANTKHQWATNKKYRKKMLEWVRSDKCKRYLHGAVIKSVEVREAYGFNPENFGDRTEKLRFIRRQAERYGISLERTSSLKKEELDALYYKLKQW